MPTTKQRTCEVCGADCRRKKVGASQGAQVICIACHAQSWRFLWGANQVVQWMRCTTCKSPVRADKSIKGEHGQHYCSQPCQDWRADDATQLAEAIAERDAAIARADAAIMRAEAAEATLKRLNTPCTWQDISGCGIYRTTCGKTMDKVTPYCPHCGRRIVKSSKP